MLSLGRLVLTFLVIRSLSLRPSRGNELANREPRKPNALERSDAWDGFGRD